MKYIISFLLSVISLGSAVNATAQQSHLKDQLPPFPTYTVKVNFPLAGFSPLINIAQAGLSNSPDILFQIVKPVAGTYQNNSIIISASNFEPSTLPRMSELAHNEFDVSALFASPKELIMLDCPNMRPDPNQNLAKVFPLSQVQIEQLITKFLPPQELTNLISQLPAGPLKQVLENLVTSQPNAYQSLAQDIINNKLLTMLACNDDEGGLLDLLDPSKTAINQAYAKTLQNQLNNLILEYLASQTTTINAVTTASNPTRPTLTSSTRSVTVQKALALYNSRVMQTANQVDPN